MTMISNHRLLFHFIDLFPIIEPVVGAFKVVVQTLGKIVTNQVRPVPPNFYIACSKSMLFLFRFSTCLADLQRNPKGQCVAISSASRADKK